MADEQADKLAIRELVEAYNDAVMRFDADDWSATWHQDGCWTLPGAGPVQGRDNIVAAWRAAMSTFEFVGFFASAGPIRVDGEHAWGRWYQQEFLHERNGPRREVTGRYEDEYVKTSNGWRFASRTYTVMQHREIALGGTPGAAG